MNGIVHWRIHLIIIPLKFCMVQMIIIENMVIIIIRV